VTERFEDATNRNGCLAFLNNPPHSASMAKRTMCLNAWHLVWMGALLGDLL